jgi:hypothetical protein
MAQQNNDLQVLDGLTKIVYGKGVHQAVPDNVKMFFDLFPFVPNGERLGNKFAESVNLAIEQGVTRLTGTAGVAQLNNSIASVNKQATVDAAAIVMQCSIAWDLVARARQPNSAQSFESALTQVVDNVLLSHRRHQVMDMLYGSDTLGTLTGNMTGSAPGPLTITLSAASTAPAIWYGSDGMLFDIITLSGSNPSGTKRNSVPFSLTGYSVDFSSGGTHTITASCASPITGGTPTTGDVIVPYGAASGTSWVTPPGLSAIAGTQGNSSPGLFGLNQVQYPMFQSSVYNNGGGALTLGRLDKASALPLTRGYTGKLKLLCNPITFSNISMEETGRVHLVGSQASGTASIGFNKVNIMTSTGAQIEVSGSPWIKEGEAYLVPMDGSVKRVGAVDIQLGGPADPSPTWRRLEGFTGYTLPTYSLQAMFTPEPWKIVKITNIVPSPSS